MPILGFTIDIDPTTQQLPTATCVLGNLNVVDTGQDGSATRRCFKLSVPAAFSAWPLAITIDAQGKGGHPDVLRTLFLEAIAAPSVLRAEADPGTAPDPGDGVPVAQVVSIVSPAPQAQLAGPQVVRVTAPKLLAGKSINALNLYVLEPGSSALIFVGTVPGNALKTAISHELAWIPRVTGVHQLRAKSIHGGNKVSWALDVPVTVTAVGSAG